MSENQENLEEKIRHNATGPKSVDIDGQKVEQHSIADQIAADEYLAKKKALRRGNGLKITKLNHSGAV